MTKTNVLIATLLFVAGAVHAEGSCRLFVYSGSCAASTSISDHAQLLPDDCEILYGHSAHYAQFLDVPPEGAWLESTVTSADFEPFLLLYGPSGTLQAGSRDALSLDLTTQGVWTLVITSSVPFGGGDYEVEAECNAAPIFVNGFESGDLTAWN